MVDSKESYKCYLGVKFKHDSLVNNHKLATLETPALQVALII